VVGLLTQISIFRHTKLCPAFQESLTSQNFAEILFQHDKTCPPTSLKIQKAITELGWTIPPQPPYSPHLGHSDFHLFDALKDVIQWQRFGMYDNVTAETKKWL
jgi:hypothetical protein